MLCSYHLISDLGAPKQERWLAAHQGKVNGFMVGVEYPKDEIEIQRIAGHITRQYLYFKNAIYNLSITIAFVALVCYDWLKGHIVTKGMQKENTLYRNPIHYANIEREDCL